MLLRSLTGGGQILLNRSGGSLEGWYCCSWNELLPSLQTCYLHSLQLLHKTVHTPTHVNMTDTVLPAGNWNLAPRVKTTLLNVWKETYGEDMRSRDVCLVVCKSPFFKHLLYYIHGELWHKHVHSNLLLWSDCISKGVFCFSWMFTESKSHLSKFLKNWKLCRRKFQWLLYCQNDLLLGSLLCNHSHSCMENRVSVLYVLGICFLFFPLLQISRQTAAWIDGWANTGKTPFLRFTNRFIM